MRRRLTAHVLGLLLGGALVGATAGAVGALLTAGFDPRVVALVVATMLTLYALRDLRGLPIPAAGRHWQVPRRWQRAMPATATFFAYGALLGAGFLTIAPYASFTALLVLEIGLGSVAVGAALGVAYGAGRAWSFSTGVLEATHTRGDYELVRRISLRATRWRAIIGWSALALAAGNVGTSLLR